MRWTNNNLKLCTCANAVGKQERVVKKEGKLGMPETEWSLITFPRKFGKRACLSDSVNKVDKKAKSVLINCYYGVRFGVK